MLVALAQRWCIVNIHLQLRTLKQREIDAVTHEKAVLSSELSQLRSAVHAANAKVRLVDSITSGTDLLESVWTNILYMTCAWGGYAADLGICGQHRPYIPGNWCHKRGG